MNTRRSVGIGVLVGLCLLASGLATIWTLTKIGTAPVAQAAPVKTKAVCKNDNYTLTYNMYRTPNWLCEHGYIPTEVPVSE